MLRCNGKASSLAYRAGSPIKPNLQRLLWHSACTRHARAPRRAVVACLSDHAANKKKQRQLQTVLSVARLTRRRLCSSDASLQGRSGPMQLQRSPSLSIEMLASAVPIHDTHRCLTKPAMSISLLKRPMLPVAGVEMPISPAAVSVVTTWSPSMHAGSAQMESISVSIIRAPAPLRGNAHLLLISPSPHTRVRFPPIMTSVARMFPSGSEWRHSSLTSLSLAAMRVYLVLST
mmetsp:Transcript_83915/g.166555  ORF Transcript_83915/g.166555 Transcript_83915/m.166555 type:complete len:232 (+) Transcript_83915:173-868(+)